MAKLSKNVGLTDLLNQLNDFTKDSERFLEQQPELTGKVRAHTKSLYDTLKEYEPADFKLDALPELIVKGFDNEQIWQEIELQNEPSINHFIKKVSKTLAVSNQSSNKQKNSMHVTDLTENDDDNDDDDDDNDEVENDESESDVNELDDNLDADEDEDSDADLERLLDQAEAGDMSGEDVDDENEVDEEPAQKKTSKKSSVDDQFFKLSEMEEFLAQEDLREERKMAGKDEEESDDDEDEDDDDDDGEGYDAMYADFFRDDVPRQANEKKTVSFEEEDHNDADVNNEPVRSKKLLESDSEGEDADEILHGKKPKSSFELRQEKMKKRISALEASSVGEKGWQLTGEVGAQSRPENSLLQEDLDFDHTSKLPPVITEETTVKLEDLIKQRVKDKAFDDVERKVKTKEDAFEYKKRITLSQEKSKQSLSEIYAQEYLNQNKDEEKEKERDPKHEEIEKMMQSLFLKLDALSNFHYTPKPAVADVKIVTNLPTIAMEEVAPVSVGDGQLLAPEEIKDKSRGVEVGETERSETDKLRARRQKKSDKRKRMKEKEKREKLVSKVNPGLGNKYSKEKALQQLEKDAKTQTGVTVIKEKGATNKNVSSKQFFQQLQDEVTSQVRAKKTAKNKNKEKSQCGGDS